MTQKQFTVITNWQQKTFTKATAISATKHLQLEVKELLSDLKTKSKGKRLEFADCFLLLFGAAKLDGMSYQDIINCIDKKMSINYKRKWSKPKKNGIVTHLK